MIRILFLLSIFWVPFSSLAKSKMSLRDAAYYFLYVSQYVLDNNVANVTEEQLLEGALNGMLTSVDPHSYYLSPSQFKDFCSETSGHFNGIGVEITLDKGFLRIISPLEDSPAYKAGLRAGDLVVKVNDNSIYGKSLVKIRELIQGTPGTHVRLTVRRSGESDQEYAVERQEINVQPVKFQTQDQIGYIRITMFNEKTTEEVKKAIHLIKKKLGNSLQSILFDLRDNAGGLLLQGVSTTDLFLTKGLIVQVKNQQKDKFHRFFAKDGDILKNIPIGVLMNRGSASAAEIFAGALKDHGRAIILGTRSFGKGSVQTLFPLKNGGGITLTTAYYVTASGRKIDANGILPDVEIEQMKNLESPSDDSYIREKNRKSFSPKPSSPQATEADRTIEDYQLHQALNVMRGIQAFRKAVPKSLNPKE